MKTLHMIAASLSLVLPLAAHADRMPAPTNTPPAFQAECASCHVAFPPSLLTAPDWKRVMGALDKHYGDNASLDEPTRKAIEDFLVRNAGGSKLGAGGTATAGSAATMGTATAGSAASTGTAGEPPRLTASTWFTRKHHEVPRTMWKDAKVKSPANCAACHTKAAAGSYREREIVMPDGRPWEDD